MLKVLESRRTVITLVCMFILLALGIYLHVDTSGAIAMVCMAVSASNASEGVAKHISQGKSSSTEEKPS